MVTICRILLICCTALFINTSDVNYNNTSSGHSPLWLEKSSKRNIDYFLDLVKASDKPTHDRSLNYIERTWKPSYEIMLLEVLYFSNGKLLRGQILSLLEKKTGLDFGFDINKWYEYIWNREQQLDPDYDTFKGVLHSYLDKKFAAYFLDRQETAQIRLDEVRWGGVLQDGIPPLRNPQMIAAKDASYLRDDNIVFGISVNGDTRAYPKRILAWHEMFVDEVGNTPVVGVYCTLCGTVILYKTEHKGVKHQMGTSGFLYRSNKLMYDKATQSLWNRIPCKANRLLALW